MPLTTFLMISRASYILILLVILSFFCNAQEYEGEITIEELLTNLVTKFDEDSLYRVDNMIITSAEQDFSIFTFLNNNFPELPKIDGRIAIQQDFFLINCLLPPYFIVDSLQFNKGFNLLFNDQREDLSQSVDLINIVFKNRFVLNGNTFEDIYISKSCFDEFLEISFNKLRLFSLQSSQINTNLIYGYNETAFLIDIGNNIFESDNVLNSEFVDWYTDSMQTSTVMDIYIGPEQSPRLNLSDNEISGTSKLSLVDIDGSYESVSIVDNDIHGILALGIEVGGKFDLADNTVSFIDLSTTGFSETSNWISFDEEPKLAVVNRLSRFDITEGEQGEWFGEDHLVDTTADNIISHGQIGFSIYTGGIQREFSFKEQYGLLIRAYYYLQKAFHDNGDIENTNLWYVKMKDLEGQRLKYQYQESGSFSTLFRYWLNRLMKFYTEHGTGPGRAILVSIWIISAFAFVYVFFPSEWDKTSKTKLIADFRVFIKKNDHGYFKPFLRLIAGLFISLLNALTLSLNSFVTLGFGRIPTTGAAKYICIMQGFIGWFLLSLFTVSLINQILF